MAQSAVVSTPLFAPEYSYFTSRGASRRRRTLPGTLLFILTAFALISALSTLFLSATDRPHLKIYTPTVQITESIPAPPAEDVWAAQVAKWVKGDPTDKFQGVSSPCSATSC